MACGIQVTWPELNLYPCSGSTETQPLDHQETPVSWYFSAENKLDFCVFHASLFTLTTEVK